MINAGDLGLSGKVALSYLIDLKDTSHRTLFDFFNGAVSAPSAYELKLRSSIDPNCFDAQRWNGRGKPPKRGTFIVFSMKTYYKWFMQF